MTGEEKLSQGPKAANTPWSHVDHEEQEVQQPPRLDQNPMGTAARRPMAPKTSIPYHPG